MPKNEELRPQAAGSPTPTAPAPSGTPLYVNGKQVSEEEYFKAAEGTYDLNFLRHHPEVRPAISTKNHGEQ